MALHWIWWIAAARLIGAELVTGTYYLFALGVASALGGLAAFAGFGVEGQFTIAGVLGVLGTIAAHRWRAKHTPPEQPPLDIGQAVEVREWRDDGTLRVAYRGSEWDAELDSPVASREKPLYIVAMRGSLLVLSDRRPAA
jgi:membrane protein implicated in regulation of membrane protease activity